LIKKDYSLQIPLQNISQSVEGIAETVSITELVNEKSEGQPTPLLHELNVQTSAKNTANGISFLNFLLFIVNFILKICSETLSLTSKLND